MCEVEVDLRPGQVLVTDAPLEDPGCGLVIPAGIVGDRYRVALLRPDSASEDSSPTVELRVEVLDETSAPTSPSVIPPSSSEPKAQSALVDAQQAMQATGRYHDLLRRREQQLVSRIGAERVVARARRSGPLPSPAQAPAPPRLSFDPETSCSEARSDRSGVLLGENEVMAIYQDSVEIPGRRLSAEHVQNMLDFFALYGLELVQTYFGQLPDVDGNGRVLVIATAHAFSDTQVVGYVWAGNYFERSSCPASDEAEVIFMNPARIRSMAQREYIALGVLSHESQHLISLYHRLRRTLRQGSETFLVHPTWMEEGRAELADEVTSRLAWSLAGGPSRNATVRGSDLRNSGSIPGFSRWCCRPEAFGVGLETARTIWYLSSQPNGLAVAPTDGIPETNIRNGAWHFTRWIGDVFGHAGDAPGAEAALFRQLTDSLTASGSEGLEAVLGRSFDQLFEDFTASVMLHGMGVPNVASGFTTYDFLSLTDLELAGPNLDPLGTYPWPVTLTDGGAPGSRRFETAVYTGPIGPTGFRIHDFTSAGSEVVLNARGVGGLKLVVARLR